MFWFREHFNWTCYSTGSTHIFRVLCSVFILQAIFAIENSGCPIADGATWEWDRMHAYLTTTARAIFPSTNEFGYCEFRLLPPSINNIGYFNTHCESKLWQQPAAGKLHTMTWRTFKKKMIIKACVGCAASQSWDDVAMEMCAYCHCHCCVWLR